MSRVTMPEIDALRLSEAEVEQLRELTRKRAEWRGMQRVSFWLPGDQIELERLEARRARVEHMLRAYWQQEGL